MEADQSTYILVTSGPTDMKTVELMQAMRGAGLRITFAGTASIAARASEAAACVVVLRPDTWKAQTIATIMRTKPACLIPVLAEPMDLPRGPWTHEAISIGDDAAQAHQAVIQALRDYLATRPTPSVGPTRRVNTDDLLLNISRRRQRRVSARRFMVAILILLVVGLGVLVGYRYSTQLPHTARGASSPFANPTAALATYATNTPGPGCDTRGQWAQANRYKITPTATGTPTATATPIEILDRYTTLQCQTDGSLLTRLGDYGIYSEIFFDGFGINPSIARHSLVQVDATIVSGNEQASITLDTHVRDYSRYSFDVNKLGHWEANIGSTVDASPIKRLAIGFLPHAAQTHTLALETDGPVMTFSIDGKKVTTVRDTTYTANDSIGFGIADSTWKGITPIRALFSNFSYKELPPSTLSTPQVFATATAAQISAQAAYTAHIPGYGCDQGEGQWQPPDAEAPGSLNCTSSGMQLTSPPNAQTITEENFYLRDGHFPANYRMSAHIDVSAAGDGCAGLATRADAQGNLYAFVICPTGSWEIELIAEKDHKILDQGTVSLQNNYTLTVEFSGSTQKLLIGSDAVSSVDNKMTSTDHVSLLVGAYTSSQSCTATFSDFTFMPLP